MLPGTWVRLEGEGKGLSRHLVLFRGLKVPDHPTCWVNTKQENFVSWALWQRKEALSLNVSGHLLFPSPGSCEWKGTGERREGISQALTRCSDQAQGPLLLLPFSRTRGEVPPLCWAERTRALRLSAETMSVGKMFSNRGAGGFSWRKTLKRKPCNVVRT